MKKRNWSAGQLKIIDQILAADDLRRATQNELDKQLAEQNRIAKQVGALIGQGKKDEAEAAKSQVAALKTASRILEERLDSVKTKLNVFRHQTWLLLDLRLIGKRDFLHVSDLIDGIETELEDSIQVLSL